MTIYLIDIKTKSLEFLSKVYLVHHIFDIAIILQLVLVHNHGEVIKAKVGCRH